MQLEKQFSKCGLGSPGGVHQAFFHMVKTIPLMTPDYYLPCILHDCSVEFSRNDMTCDITQIEGEAYMRT